MDFHPKISEYFDRLIANNELSHGYLFTGEEGVGKFYFAENLAEKIAEKNSAGTANLYPDILIIGKEEESRQITLKQVIGEGGTGGISNFLNLRPQILGKRMVLIRNAHLLGHEAQNAILKIIEEPPPDSLIVLTTHLEEKILPTIKSRLARITFRPAPDELIKKFLFLGENCDVKTDDLNAVAAFSFGRIGRALWLKNNLSEFKQNIEKFKMFLNGNIGQKFSFIEKISRESEELKKFLDESVFILRNDLILKIDRQSVHSLRTFLNVKNLIENTNVNPRLQLENLALSSIKIQN